MSGNENGVRSRHAFVAMPFGIKESIDFDAVYKLFIRPALEQAGFEVLRADEEEAAGNIRLDMFQELLLADLVLVDLTIDNPNVWYELGVRHALRSRGIVHVSSRTSRTPFDVATDRQFRYKLVDGLPDHDTLDTQIAALARVALSTIDSWRGRKISPIYTLLPFLHEPDWKSLRVGSSNEFWEKYEHWEQRIEIAGKRMRARDILVLADETPTQHLRLEAHRTAAKALLDAGQFAFAVLQVDKALKVDPDDLKSARLKGLLLGRTDRNHAAASWLNDLLVKHPGDAETLALLGRVRKNAWENTWNSEEVPADDRRVLASDNDGIMLQSLDAYRRGFESDPRHYYSGINALTMLRLYEHVSLDKDSHGKLATELEGGIRWALASARAREPNDPWVQFTAGELDLLCGNEGPAIRGYKDGVACMRRDWFALDAVRQQLNMFRLLEFQPELVCRVARIVERALEQLKPPWRPRRIFLFSGHMVDKADREAQRFPDHPLVIAEARARINAWFEERGAGSEDLALSSAACGGDLLFAQAAMKRGLKLDIRLPFARAEFLRRSVAFAGADWIEAFHTVTTSENTKLRVMTDEIGPAPPGINDFARNNLWMLYSALSGGAERLQFLCLWNGQEGDGPGGTRNMVDTIRQHAGFADIIDSNELLETLPHGSGADC